MKFWGYFALVISGFAFLSGLSLARQEPNISKLIGLFLPAWFFLILGIWLIKKSEKKGSGRKSQTRDDYDE